MIGPVSGTGRAMMASLQQAIQKGMPPDQAIQYVKSMATQGVAPMTDLYAMVNQFQRLKQQQVQPPQTPPTIKDQLNMMDQMQRMQGGIAGMQAPAPQGNPMDRGLGAIDAGRMEYPKFVGGGVVALAQGGDFDVEQVYSRGRPEGTDQFDLNALYEFGKQASPEELARMYALALSRNDFDTASRLEPVMRQKGLTQDYLNYVRKNTAVGVAGVRDSARQAETNKVLYGDTNLTTAAPPPPSTNTGARVAGTAGTITGVPTSIGGVDAIFKREREALEGQANKTLEQQLAETEALEAKMGIGKAAEERGKYLDRREAEAGKQLAEDRRMALAQAGFAMAEAASRRGRERTGFLGAAAIGGTRGAQLIDKAVRENRALKDSIAENRFALAQANEMRKAGNIKEAKALESQAKANLRALSMAEAQSKQSLAELGIRESGQDRRTAMQVAAERERYQAAAKAKQDELLSELIQSGALSGDSDIAKQLRALVTKNLSSDVNPQIAADLAKYGQ